jgi:nucleobase:cation symporter-1, NCS1 family
VASYVCEGERVKETPSWGIDPVPARLHVLGGVDSFLLWLNLGISLLVLVAASYFGLSLKQALLATVLGGLIGNLMLAIAAYIGADARVPSMALQRAPLGRRGSYLATTLNAMQCLGWSVFEITVIAVAAGALCNRIFGVELVWMWKLVFGGVGLVLALLGPVGFVRRYVRRIGIWAVVASVVYLAVWILQNGHVAELWHEGGHGGSFIGSSFWLAVDLVIALTVSWIPLVADYTRFSRTPRAAFWGAGVGYLLPTLFQFGFGSILVLSHPSISGPTDVLTTVAAGGIGSLLALLALTVDETDEAFANIYSAAVSLQNYVPRTSQRLLIVGVSVVATAISLGIDLTQYQQFLLLLGAFFVPLFGVLLADWLVAGRHYTAAHVFDAPTWRPGMIASWLAGFLVYEWLAQTQGLGFWSRFLGDLHPLHGGIGSSLPGFAVSFGLALFVSYVGSRVDATARRNRASLA